MTVSGQTDLEQQGRDFDPNTKNTDGRYWEKTAELRSACPVFVSEQLDGFTAVVDHGLVAQAMRDWRTEARERSVRSSRISSTRSPSVARVSS